MAKAFSIRTDIQKAVSDSGKCMTDLARELSMNYDSLCHYIKGRRKMSPELNERINEVIGRWNDV